LRKLAVFLFLLGLFCPKARASASDIYITQTGATNAPCLVSVQTLAFFNNASNWAAGGTQIGSDTIVHLCGTFTAGTGLANQQASTLTNVQNGPSGPVTIKNLPRRGNLWVTGTSRIAARTSARARG
jgi:hypothetical protein